MDSLSNQQPFPAPLKFTTTPLIETSNDVQSRFHQLISLVCTHDWWNSLFQDWCFIAGSAALFVADPHGDINRVGDIDIWFAPHQTNKLEQHIKELCDWFEQNNIEFSFRLQNGSLKIYNSRMILQFVAVDLSSDKECFSCVNEMVDLVLANFDYEPVQFAVGSQLVSSDAPKIQSFVPSLFMSKAASLALITRRIAWRNTKLWDQTAPCFNSPVGYHKTKNDKQWTRDAHRLAKLAHKGFYVVNQTETQQFESKPRHILFPMQVLHDLYSLSKEDFFAEFKRFSNNKFEYFVTQSVSRNNEYAVILPKVENCEWVAI